MKLVKIKDCALVGCENALPMSPPHMNLYKKTYTFCSQKCRRIAVSKTATEACELMGIVGMGASLKWFSCLKDKFEMRRSPTKS